MSREFVTPSEPISYQNQPRRVGYELEFAGIDLSTAGKLIADTVSGNWVPLSKAEDKIKTDVGTIKIEIDWQFAKTTARQRIAQRAQELGTTKADDPFMEWMTKLATIVVPVEVVCPPLTVEQLPMLHPMVDALRENGALGTGSALLYAFGVHINPELPANDSPTIIAYLQSFTICQHWLLKHHKVDLMRRVTPYINLYPELYREQVMNYQGDEPLSQVMDDYLEFNATRNRALDMLPLFMYLDPDRIHAALDDPLVNPRPTLHYRLPNCEIERPDWDLAKSWNVWCVVETIANDAQLRQRLIQLWLKEDHLANRHSEKIWQELEAIYQNLLSA